MSHFLNSPPLNQVSAWRRFGLAVLVLSLVFWVPLAELASLALRQDLYSHILLVPAVSAYLIWTDRPKLPAPDRAGWVWFIVLSLLGIICVGVAAAWSFESPTSRLAVWILAYVFGVAAAGSALLGRRIFRHCSFAFGFLVFLVPMPDALIHACETGLQYASADAANWFFIATRTPSLRDGLFFQLPGLYIEVAQECSGFRSSLVLFIVSTVAAKMFLQTPWKRALLVASVIPLGIARNAFRIYTLAALSVYVNPDIMHSDLHRRGGPLFFALSLIPLNVLLWILYRSDRRRGVSDITATAKANAPTCLTASQP